MTDSTQRLSFREKAGYALGDAATNFFFQAMILYQGRFYTDVMGLSSSAVAWLFLIVRGWDAIFDPLVGTLADRTNSRWGKFRPWILWTAVPYGLVLWSAYTVPGFAGSAKVVYAYVTYVLLMMFYSANNTPYSALNGVMTGDVNERTSLAQYRFVAAMSAQLVVQGFTLPLVDKFGGGNVAKGWSITFAIFGGLVILFSLVAFFSSRERVRPDPAQKVSLRQDVAGVFKCRPWVAMFLLTIFVFTTLALRGTSMYYYFTYFVDKAALLDFVRSFGLGTIVAGHGAWWKTGLGWFGFILTPDGSNASSVGFSLFNIAGTIVTILGVLCSNGHNPMILFRGKTKEVYFLKPKGYPVGVDLPDADMFNKNMSLQKVDLEKNDMLVIYTDGITEAMNVKKEQFGETRLIQVIKDNYKLTPSEFVEKLNEAIARFTRGAEQNDDITVVAIKEKMRAEQVEFKFRKNLIALVEKKGLSVAEACRQMNISPNTYYRFKKIFDEKGKEGLKPEGGKEANPGTNPSPTTVGHGCCA